MNALSQLFYRFAVGNCPPELAGSDVCQTNLPQIKADQPFVATAVQLGFGVIGVVAMIFLIIGGFKYIVAQGEPQATNQARQTVIYAAIGLVIALSAEIIITFVINNL